MREQDGGNAADLHQAAVGRLEDGRRPSSGEHGGQAYGPASLWGGEAHMSRFTFAAMGPQDWAPSHAGEGAPRLTSSLLALLPVPTEQAKSRRESRLAPRPDIPA